MSASEKSEKTPTGGTWWPTQKMSSALTWGATVTVVGYALREWAHVELPTEVWASLGVVVTWLGGYLKRETPKTVSAPDDGDYERRMGRP